MAVVRVVPVVPHNKDITWWDHKLGEGVGRCFIDKGLHPLTTIHKELAITNLYKRGSSGVKGYPGCIGLNLQHCDVMRSRRMG